jgi:uridine kinase
MKILKSKFLMAGLTVRIICLILVPNGFVTDFYYPFFSSINGVNVDPWSNWVQNGGRLDSFPYGLILFTIIFCVFLLDLLVSNLLDSASSVIIFAVMLLLIDLYLYQVLKEYANEDAAILYISSPIVIYVSFLTLQSDSIVGLFVFLFCLSILNRKKKLAGIFLGLAIGSKFGILLVIPFILAFALVNKRFRKLLLESLLYSIPISLISYIPALWSSGFRTMVFESETASEVYSLSVKMNSFEFLVFPAVYILLMLWIWRSGHSNTRVLIGFIGISLFLLGVMSLGFVGWHLWGFASLLIVLVNQEIHLKVVFYAIQFLVVLRYIIDSRKVSFQEISDTAILLNLIFTSLLILASVWSLSSLRRLLASADLLRLNDKPLLISISGDSGVGKDTVANALARVFGVKNTTIISGDSFHKFERDHNSWKAKTHLNPLQNHLTNWERTISSALNRNRFSIRHYEHSVGKFTEVSPYGIRDLIISQGLHGLTGKLANKSDLKIYLEMPDDLRVKYKIARDTSYRKQAKSRVVSQIKSRRSDFKKFLEPQKELADLIVEQSSSSRQNLSISRVKFTFTDQEMGSRVYQSFLPLMILIELTENSSGQIEIEVNNADKLTALEFHQVLRNSLNAYDELDIKVSEIPPGSSGLVACIGFICIEYIRQGRN